MSRRRRGKRVFKVSEAFLQHLVEFCRRHPHLDATRFVLIPGSRAKDGLEQMEGPPFEETDPVSL